jgi:hypothetical protein
MNQTCKNCGYVRLVKDWRDGIWGEHPKHLVCKRFPPTVAVDFSLELKYPDKRIAIWPSVDEDDWCGEWVDPEAFDTSGTFEDHMARLRRVAERAGMKPNE